ncbi:fibrinogen-like protein 1 [Glandiceps talaboti]
MARQYIQMLFAVILCMVEIPVVMSQNLNLGENRQEGEVHVQAEQSDSRSCQYTITVPTICTAVSEDIEARFTQLTEELAEWRSITANQIEDLTKLFVSPSQNIGFDQCTKFQKSHRDCNEVFRSNPTMTSGVYKIQPWDSPQPFHAYCQANETDVWTVIQRRLDGSVNFYKDWQAYKNGFGNRTGEFWLGNDNIYYLTSQGHYKLRIDLEDWEGGVRYAEYDRIWIDGENEKYRLHLGEYSGNAGDAFSYHNNYRFTTKDQDNDGYSENCAQLKQGGWWFNRCQQCSLNGLYFEGGHYQSDYNKGVQWTAWKSSWYSLKKVTMKIIATT